MAHDKVYAICENMCLEETLTKEQIEKLIEKSVIQLSNVNQITYAASMERTVFPFDRNDKKLGDAFEFEVSSNRIKVKKNVKCARFDLLLRYALVNNTQNYGFSVHLVRNNQTFRYFEVTQELSKNWDAVKLAGYFYDLEVGDFIQVEWFQSSVGAIVAAGQASSYFIVCEV